MNDAPFDGLFGSVVRRLRVANTIFGQNVKLVLRQMSDDQWALLTLPYLLVVPTVTRIEGAGGAVSTQPVESIVNPRSITLLAQLDGRGSEDDWRAAIDIEIAERQLIGALVNWRPQAWYRPTAYAGMRVEATRAPAVKVAFVFTFYEELFPEPDFTEELCAALAGPGVELGRITFAPRVENCEGPRAPPPDPCADPCEPCAPDKVWSAAMWLDAKGEDDDDGQGAKRRDRVRH